MSRFDEEFDRDLTVIAERVTPSPTAWEEIQQRIANRAPTTETEIIMLTDNTLTTRRWPLVAAAAAVAALAITGIALVNRGDGADQPADPPTPTFAPDGADDVTTDQQSDTATAVSPLPAEGQALPAGRYAPFTLGLPVEFDVPTATASPWTVQVSNQVTVNVGNDDGFVVFTRVGSLYDADQAQDPGMTGLGSIPPDDIDGWIEANGVVVVDSREETIDGRTARFRQVTAPQGAGDATESCPAELRPCLSVASASADLQDTYDGVSMAVFGENPHSFWFVELDDFEPLAVWVSAVAANSDDWLAEVQPLIASITLGDPVPATEFGQALLSTFAANTGTRELPNAGAALEPGRYASDSLGVPIEFEVDVGQTASWALLNDDPGRIWINSNESDNEFVAIGRLGSWYDATEARTESTTGLGSIPPDDIDGWIAQNGIIVIESDEVEVGGRSAEYRQVRLDTTPGATADFCGGAPCLWAVTGSADVPGATADPIQIGFDRAQSIWVIDMGEYEPVYIFAASQLGDDADQQWFADVVQPIVDSMTFGEPAPAVEGGTARVPLRVTGSAPYSGVRTDSARLADGSTPVDYAATTEGTMTGEIVGTGVWSIDTEGISSGSDEATFTGTIEGLGTGTLSWMSEWTAPGPAQATVVDTITGGTGDFIGVTGTLAVAVDSSERVGIDDTVTGTITFDLVVPRSG